MRVSDRPPLPTNTGVTTIPRASSQAVVSPGRDACSPRTDPSGNRPALDSTPERLAIRQGRPVDTYERWLARTRYLRVVGRTLPRCERDYEGSPDHSVERHCSRTRPRNVAHLLGAHVGRHAPLSQERLHRTRGAPITGAALANAVPRSRGIPWLLALRLTLQMTCT